MSCSNRHIAMEVGQHNIASLVDVASLKIHNPALSVFSPVNPSAFVVDLIGRGVHVAKIAKSVIKRIAVYMVNNVRLLIVSKKPRNAVGQVALPVKKYDPVSGTALCGASNRSSSAVASANFIEYLPCFGIVSEVMMNRIRNNLRSHAELPLSLVRGSVVGATDSPILPEFALSGGDKRGRSALTEPHPIRRSL